MVPWSLGECDPASVLSLDFQSPGLGENEPHLLSHPTDRSFATGFPDYSQQLTRNHMFCFFLT